MYSPVLHLPNLRLLPLASLTISDSDSNLQLTQPNAGPNSVPMRQSFPGDFRLRPISTNPGGNYENCMYDTNYLR